MITETTQNDIQRFGITNAETQFKIKACGKAFRILSDGLYSDKIGAILRELGCNAYDSHVAAGNNDPFLIHLPNRLEPHFSVRDFGTGLDHSDVVNVFTTYFESTKTNSNEFVGCLGLGSKSPFSYTDQFTVTSFYQGVKRLYNAFINEDGVPSICMLTEEPTTESNGLEINFPVQQNSFYEFQSKTPNIFRYFNITPTIVGQTVTVPKVEYSFKGNNWGIRNDGGGIAHAIMGNVCYPLSSAFDTQLTPFEQAIVILPIDIRFNIGELEVSASRESLSYNKATKANIRNTFKVVGEEIVKQIQDTFTGCKTMWEARLLAHKIMQGEYRNLAPFLKTAKMMWNGQEVSNEWIKLEPDFYTKYPNFKLGVVRKYYRRGEKFAWDIVTTVSPKEDTHFLERNIVHGMAPRLAKFYDDNDVSQIYLVDSDVPEAIDEFKKIIGYEGDVVKVSTLPFDPAIQQRMQSDTNPLNKISIMKYNHLCAKGWESVVVDTANTKNIYVEVDRYRIQGRDSKDYIRSYLRVLETLNGSPMTLDIYGVKPRELEKNKSIANNWVKLEVYVREQVDAYFTANNLEDMRAMSDAIGKFGDSLDYRESNVYDSWVKGELCAHILTRTDFACKAEFETFLKAHKVADKMERFDNIAGYGSATVTAANATLSKSYVETFAKMYKQLKADYAMMFRVQYVDLKDMHEYMDLMDEARAYREEKKNQNVSNVVDEYSNI